MTKQTVELRLATMATTVVNIRREPYDVYIGRAGRGQDGTFGNPFKDGTKEENIKLFKKYFYRRVRIDSAYRDKVLTLKNKRLGCFCAPSKCHGDVIAEFLNAPPVKLAVVGSRTFEDFRLMKQILDNYDISQIISGGAIGADALARKYATEHNIELIEYLPDWKRHKKSAGYIRNKLIVEQCDEIVVFWDGLSKGSQHSIQIAEELDKPLLVIKFHRLSGEEPPPLVGGVLEIDEIARLGF